LALAWKSAAHLSIDPKRFSIARRTSVLTSSLFFLSAPLVVIDVYEHAYYVDYKNNKNEYIERFMSHIDWEKINRRYKQSVKPKNIS
jgi:superoxide dismutase